MHQNKKELFSYVAIIFGVAVCARFLPHIPNSAPVGALALFAGAQVKGRFYFLLPLLALFATDLFIGFYNPFVMLTVYGSYVCVALLGRAIRTSATFQNVSAFSVLSSTIFFIVTNAAVWQFGSLYTHSYSGLILCYVMALPFYAYTLVGDLFWNSIFFGGYAFYKKLFHASASHNREVVPQCS